MIQANELRVGNWVQHEPHPEEKLRAARKEFLEAEIQMEWAENRFHRAESNLKDIKLRIKKLK